MECEINILAEKDKDEALQIIYQAIEGLSREDTARLIYRAFQQFACDVDARMDALAQIGLDPDSKPH